MYRRTVDGTVLDFGTSGNLRFSNLIMYDRQTESWWQEFGGEAIVGDLVGKKLEQLYLSIVSWKDFKEAFPMGKVLSKDTGNPRPYGQNPYVGYDLGDPFLFSGSEDSRLQLIERVVAVTIGKDALAVPFRVLEKEGVVHYNLGGRDLVIFLKKGTASSLDARAIAEGRDVGATGVFDPILDGDRLTFVADGGQIVDEQTGSAWNLFGHATSGPLAGEQLTPIPNRGSQFWFSWAVFKPDTEVYLGK